MADPLILHIESATDICSVALSEGDVQLSLIESGPERSHATLLSAYIRKAMANGNRSLKELDAVSVSKGPGSYTGLRIGVSTAKGLTYALGKPLLSTGTLKNMAHGAATHPSVLELLKDYGDGLLLCPMLDARRMEVYAAFYSMNLTTIRDVAADLVDHNSYLELLNDHHICFFGNGSPKCRETIEHPHAHFIDGINPSAAHMIGPALRLYQNQQFEDVAYFEPFYLKDFVATKPRKKVL